MRIGPAMNQEKKREELGGECCSQSRGGLVENVQGTSYIRRKPKGSPGKREW